jgi:hypothetical protein
MIMVWLRLAMALSLLLLVACEGDTNDITVVNSQEDVDPVEILSSARLDASSADGAQPVDALTDDTPQPIDDPGSETF